MLPQKTKTCIIGLMSGTSLDGLDVACCEFEYEYGQWKYSILAATTYDYSTAWKEKLQTMASLSAVKFVQEDMKYGKLLGEYVRRFLKEYPMKPQYVASHGHTIFHQPEHGFTFQIGNGAAIAAVCRLPVICDFRTTDVALGGQGAPLVPVGDALLFGDYDYCLNLGGIANISYSIENQRIAFDVCPTNMALNFLAQAKGLPFDDQGKIARNGKVDKKMLQELNQLPYYATQGAKSLGREWFEKSFLPLLVKGGCSIEDVLATCTEHIAYQIQRSISSIPKEKILVTGGGAKNVFLIEKIKEYLPTLDIVLPDMKIIDYKEALVFAFLGCLRINNQINVLKSVTGAKENSISGGVYL